MSKPMRRDFSLKPRTVGNRPPEDLERVLGTIYPEETVAGLMTKLCYTEGVDENGFGGAEMKNCKQCVHRRVCQVFTGDTTLLGGMTRNFAGTCTFFMDRAKYKKVVFCKDCKSWTHIGDGIGECANERFHLDDSPDPTMSAEEYCSLGERRNGE